MWWAGSSAQQRQDDLDRLREIVAASGTTVVAPGHEVTVTIGPGGALNSVEISSRGARLDAATLAAVILTTLRAATDEARQSLVDQLCEVTGGVGYVDSVGGVLPAVPEHSGDLDSLDSLAALDDTPPADDADEVERRLAAMAVQVRADLRAYRQATAELADRTVTASTPDGTVGATVSAAGRVEDITIRDAALRSGPQAVGRMVCTAVLNARAQAALLTAERIQQTGPGRLDLRQLVESAQPDDLRPRGDPSDQRSPRP